MPIGLSLLFACCLYNKNPFRFIFAYLLAFSLATLDPIWIIVASFECVAILGLISLKKNIKVRFFPYVYGILLFIVQLPQVFIFSTTNISILIFVILDLLSIAFYYLFCKLLSAIRNRGIRTNFLVDELFALFILASGLSFGASSISWNAVTLSSVLTLVAMFILVNLTSKYPVIFCSIASGFAHLLAFGEYNFLVIYMVWALCLSMLKKAPKVLNVIVLLVADIMLGLVFGVYSNYTLANFLMVCLCGMVFVCLPRKLDLTIQRKLEFVKPSSGQLEELFKKNIKDKLEVYVKLLYDIDSTYKDMIIPMSTFEKSKKELAKEICANVCTNCLNRKICYEKSPESIAKSVERTLEISVKKGEVYALDIPPVLSKCSNASIMMSNIKSASKKYLEIMKQAGAGNFGKLVIGNQLKGVADTLNNFNRSLVEEYRAPREMEKSFLSELWFNDIVADDCQIILSQEQGFKSVSILLKMNTNKEKLVNIAEKYFGEKLKECESRYSNESGWQIIRLEKKPRFGFVFGSATVGHNGKIINGDCHSCIKLDGDKYLLSIADGKGHGKEAQKTSNLTMKLIEDFYKANISTDIVVSSVNQILSFNSGENFSAVDICIVNLNDGEASFVKLGSTPTVIKRGNKVRVISGSGLPMGVSAKIVSSYDNEFLNVGDIVVMTSDGVFDGFGDTNNFAGYINNLKTVNMDFLAKKLIEESIRRTNGKIKDDLTVVAFRWFVDL